MSRRSIAMAAAKLATLQRGAKQHVGIPTSTPTQTDAAQMMGVSRWVAAEAFGLGTAKVSKMSTDPNECRANELLCFKRARTATTIDTRQLFVDLAASWNRIAVELEAAASFTSVVKELKAGKERGPQHHDRRADA